MSARFHLGKQKGIDHGGNPLHVGDEVHVKGYVAANDGRTSDGVVVLFTDVKASHWTIEFHPADLNP